MCIDPIRNKVKRFQQMRQANDTGNVELKRKPTQRGGGCCVGVPLINEVGGLRYDRLNPKGVLPHRLRYREFLQESSKSLGALCIPFRTGVLRTSLSL